VKRTFQNIGLLLCCVVFLVGCNLSFEPLKENDKYFFTIYGYLDASADTQWVRIVPPREQLDAPHEVPEMHVTLENIETGESVIMNDSLFASGSGFNYINYYTLMDVEPEQTYRITAEHPDGRASDATLTTPSEFPTPMFFKDTFAFVDRHIHQIIITGVAKENLIDVQTWWFARREGEEIRKFTFSYRNTVEKIDTYGGAYVADVVCEEEEEVVLREFNVPSFFESDVELLDQQIYVAVAGPEWNEEIPSFDDLIYAQPDYISNIENGLGYMVGIYSKVIPYKTCHTANRSQVIPCEVEKPFW
jgi:hypothetical protein